MLDIPTEFPHPGSTAYLRPLGEEVRVIQQQADGRRIVAINERFKRASSTRTVFSSELAPSREEALPLTFGRKRRS